MTRIYLRLIACCTLLGSLIAGQPGYAQIPSKAVAVDATGAIHIAGIFSERITLGDTTLAVQEATLGAFLARLKANGEVLWARLLGEGDTYGYDITSLVTDGDGYGYVSGTASDSIRLEPGLWAPRAYIARYDQDGVFQWTSSEIGSPLDLAMDAQGDLLAVGATFFDTDTYVGKFDATGNLLWRKQLLEGRGTLGLSIAFGSEDRPTITGGAGDYLFVSQLDENGEERWTYQTEGGSLWGSAVALDAQGNSYFAGSFAGTIEFSDTLSLTEGGRFVAKLNAQGELVWAHAITGLQPEGDLALVLDEANRVHVAVTTSRYNGVAQYGLYLAGYDAAGSQLYTRFLKDVWTGPYARNFLAVDGERLYVVGAAKAPDTLPEVATLLHDPEELFFLGSIALSTIVDRESEPTLPGFELLVAYPNPVRGTSTIEYEIPSASMVEVFVYDVLGRRKAVLTQSWQTAGRHTLFFDATSLSSGIYFVQLRAGKQVQARAVAVSR